MTPARMARTPRSEPTALADGSQPRLIAPADLTLVEICADELWGGVYCTLPPGHAGSHQSAPSTQAGCALTWRSAVEANPPAPTPTSARLEPFLRMVRGASVAHR